MTMGMIITESLEAPELLKSPPFEVTDRYGMLMDGTTPVEITMVDVVSSDLLRAMGALAFSLKKQGYYAHFVDGRTMYVVLPLMICIVRWDNSEDQASCRKIASLCGVPPSQLPFQKMFVFGHAEHD